MKTLLGDDIDRAVIGPRARVLQAARTSNGASRRIPVLLRTVVTPTADAPVTAGSGAFESSYRSVARGLGEMVP